jgi:hypothetical protein
MRTVRNGEIKTQTQIGIETRRKRDTNRKTETWGNIETCRKIDSKC